MKHAILAPRTLPLAILAAIVLLIAADPAFSAQRTFVHSSPLGSDANQFLVPPCALATPCRTFNAAILVTDPKGEVVILDTAGYGPMTINKSIKIIGPSGVYGGISVLGGAGPPPPPTTGVVINAGDTDEITLRGLDISGVPGLVGPFPNIGIDVQNAAVVHIEKSSIGNFTQDDSACINVQSPNTTRVFVVDSLLRECNCAIFANGTTLLPNRSSVLMDNTRIERGKNTGGTGGLTFGVAMQGYMDVSIRNSVISREDFGIEFVDPVSGGSSHLTVINSEITRATAGISYSNAIANAVGQISIEGSQLVNTGGISVSTSAAGGGVSLNIARSRIEFSGGDGIHVANSAPAGTVMFLTMSDSQIANIPGSALDLSATSGGQVIANVRDSTLAQAGTLLKTSGASPLTVGLIRSNLHGGQTAIDHGHGVVLLDGSHVSLNAKSFVNNGSGSIMSLKNNFVFGNIDAPGPVYITPSFISPE